MKKPSEILQEIKDKVKDKTCDGCLFGSCGDVGKAMVITDGECIGILEDKSYPICHAWEPKTSKNYSPLSKRQYLWKLSMAIYLEKIFDDIATGGDRHGDLTDLLSVNQRFLANYPQIGTWNRVGDVIREFFDLDHLPKSAVRELMVAGVIDEKKWLEGVCDLKEREPGVSDPRVSWTDTCDRFEGRQKRIFQGNTPEYRSACRVCGNCEHFSVSEFRMLD